MAPLVWFLAMSAADAHRPGLARVAVDEDGVAITLAVEDLGDHLPPNTRPDEAPELVWEAVGARTVVTSGGAPCRIVARDVGSVPPNGVVVRGALSCPGGGPYALTAPWLDLHDGFVASVEAWGAPNGVLSGPAEVAILEPRPRWGVVAERFLALGIRHIGTGYDHVAFVLALVLGAETLRDVLLVATGFTLAHSLTLGLAATGVLSVPSSVVEPLIALSIVLVAVENRLATALPVRRRAATAFGFGLIHGLGFAGALGAIGLPVGARLLSLGAFNVGVECGQAAIVLLTWPALRWARDRGHGDRVGLVGSLALGACGLWWLLQRLA